MQNVIVDRHNGSDLDQSERNDNPTHRTALGTQPRRVSGRGLDWRVMMACVLFIGVAVLFLLVRFVGYLTDISQQTSYLDVWIVAALKASPLLFIGVGVYWFIGSARRNHIAYLPNNMPIHTRDIAAVDWQQAALGSMAAYYQNQNLWAEHSTYASLNTLDASNKALPQSPLTALSAPPSDVKPDSDVTPVPPSEWQKWIDDVPHILLSARTKSGKSTLAKAILAPRIDAGEKALIIDPHSSVWFGLPLWGGGGNWQEVQQAINAVTTEYTRRMQERKAYSERTGKELPVTHFTRLTVICDEANECQFNLDKTVWKEFAQVLSSGSRKVNISIILLCQSANVLDLGISKPMRENFFRIALDDSTADFIIKNDESDSQRKQALRTALRGRKFPSVCEYLGVVYLLDREGLDLVAPPSSLLGAAWSMPDNELLSTLLNKNRDDNRDDNVDTDDDNDNDEVSASDSEVINVSSVIITPAEAAKIAMLLQSSSASNVAKKIDGYNGRNYRECKAKVAKVQQMIGA